MTITPFRKPRDTPAEEIVRIQVERRISGHVPPMRLSLAQARAEQNIMRGLQMQTAIDRAVSWALSAD